MKTNLVALPHSGRYDCYDFLPWIDYVEYTDGDTLESIVARYNNPKGDLVKGAFICHPRSVEILTCTLVDERMVSHYYKSLASAAIHIIGVLPEVGVIAAPCTTKSKLQALEELADELMVKHAKHSN